jgi:histidinol phosphatase-like enzyme
MSHSYSSPFAPLPHTVPDPRAIFVDRWGTLLVPPEAGFARTPRELEFYEGAEDALFHASRAGWLIYLLGNEDAVARGQLSAEKWGEVEMALLARLGNHGINISRSYACLEHPDGVPGRDGDSVYLLPNTGAFYHAFHTEGAELRRSWVIGDSTVELVAGWRAGCRLAAVECGLGLSDAQFHVEPEIRGASLADVIRTMLSVEEPIYG